MKAIPPVIFAVCLALLASTKAAGDVVSNFANEKNQACEPFVVSDSALFAGSFTTGSFGGGYKLGQVWLSIVSVSLDATASNPGGKFTVQLWSDAAGAPGSLVQKLFGASVPSDGLKPGSNSSYSGGSILSANTTYWISATVLGGNDLSVSLELTNLKTEIGSPGWSIGDKSFSLVDGTPGLDDVCIPYLKLTEVVPEPHSIAVLGMGAAGFSLLLRRRRSF